MSASARYVAIITDGNGRWAGQRGLPIVDGHRAGADVVKARLRDAVELGIEELTIFSFSTENWSRSTEEVSALMEAELDRMAAEVALRSIDGLAEWEEALGGSQAACWRQIALALAHEAPHEQLEGAARYRNGR